MTDAVFLIVKQGLYYRPNSQGYTGIKEEAGRYSQEEAQARSYPNGERGPRDGMSYIHEDDAPEYSSACYWDTKIDHQRKVAEREIEALRAQLAAAEEREKAARAEAWEEAIGDAAAEVLSFGYDKLSNRLLDLPNPHAKEPGNG